MGIDLFAMRGPDAGVGAIRRPVEGEGPGDFDLLLGALRAPEDQPAQPDGPVQRSDGEAADDDTEPADADAAGEGPGSADADSASGGAGAKADGQEAAAPEDKPVAPRSDDGATPSAADEKASDAAPSVDSAATGQQAGASAPRIAVTAAADQGADIAAAPVAATPATDAAAAKGPGDVPAQPGAFAAILSKPAEPAAPLDAQDLSDALEGVVRQTGAVLAALPQDAPAATVQAVVAEAGAKVAALVARLNVPDAARPVLQLAAGAVPAGPMAAAEGFATAVQALRVDLKLPVPAASGPVVLLQGPDAPEPRAGQAAAANDPASAATDGGEGGDPRTPQTAGGQGRVADAPGPTDAFKQVAAAAPRDAALPPPLPAAEARAAAAPQGPAAPAAARAADAPPSPLPAEAAQQIRKASFSEERTRIELSPRGAGGLEVDLEPAEAGKLRVVIRAENPAMLQALRSDRDTLQALLTGSGLSSGNGGLEYESFGDRRRRDDFQAGQGGAGADCGEDDQRIEPARRHIPAGRLDIIT